MPVVKIRANRQVTIPKTIFDELGLEEGQFVKVVRQQNGVFFKPKKLVDSDIEEALRDIDEGRVVGPFNTAKAAIKTLRSTKPWRSSSPKSFCASITQRLRFASGSLISSWRFYCKTYGIL